MRAEGFYKENEYAVFRAAGPVLSPEDPWDVVAMARQSPDAIVDVLIRSGLTGRGGAGFPLGLKWKSVREENSPSKYVICNSAEGEPGTSANRIIWERVPEKVLCGMAVCAEVIGARKAYIYLRQEYGEIASLLKEMINTHRRELGNVDIEIFFETGGYVCGEETALMETIEGNRGEPRLKPPYPTVEGVFHCPTVLNNVESFANVPGILLHGEKEFRSRGTEKNPGTKLYTISGPVVHPGVYELPIGVSLRELYEACGGLKEGNLKGMQVGGASGNFLKTAALDMMFAPGVDGISFGVGDVRFLADYESVPEMTYELMQFFANESCGMCIPCKYGLMDITARLEQLLSGKKADDNTDLFDVGRYVSQSARCAMGQAASGCLLSALNVFASEFDALMKGGG